jgi:hypothetical protein
MSIPPGGLGPTFGIGNYYPGMLSERGLSSSSCGCLVLVAILLIFVSVVGLSLIR